MKKKKTKKMSIQSAPPDENDLIKLLKSKEDLATLNPQLIQKGVGFLLSIVESHDEVRDIIIPQLVKLGLPVKLIDLLAVEISKLEGDERLPERYPVLDVILRAIKALSVIDSCSQQLCSSKKLFHLLATLILTDKIEVAESCVTAAVLIANLLSNFDGLILEINKDQLFLQGLLDIFPFASDDIEARNAIWDVISRLLTQVQEEETSPLKLHQYVSVLASKSDLIEEELLDHQLAASNKDQENSTTSSRNLHIRTEALKRIDFIASQWLTSKDQDSPISFTEDCLVNKRDLDRLMVCCQKYSKISFMAQQQQSQGIQEQLSQDIPQQVLEEPHQLSSEELVPVKHRIRIGPTNFFVPKDFKCEHQIIVEILKNHPIYPALSLSTSSIPIIYIQQFWYHIHVFENTKPQTLRTTIHQYTFDLTVDFFRTVLRLPAATDNLQRGFETPPNRQQLIDFLLKLGYDTDESKLNRLSDFRRMMLPTRWATLFSILNRCLTGKEFGLDNGRMTLFQIMYGVVNRCHFDFAQLIWDALVELVIGKKESKKKEGPCIPFVRYIKLIIQALMHNQHILARPGEPTYEDKPMHSLQTDANATKKLPTDIPQDLLDLADKSTNVYKDFVGVAGVPMENSKPSRPTPGTHRNAGYPNKGKKKQLAKKVDLKAKKNVEKESDGINELLKAIDEMVDLSPAQNLEEVFGTNVVDLSQAPEPATKEPKKTAPTPISPPTITTTFAITTPIPTTTSTPKTVAIPIPTPTPTPIMTKTTTEAPTAPRNIHATAMHYVTEGTFKKALDSLTGQIEERLSTFTHRQGQDVVGPSQRHQSSTMEYLKALMLMQFIDNTKLREAEPQLFSALLVTSSQSTTENIIREEFQSIRESMDHTTSHFTKAISELSDRVTSLEENCRPQSRKRRQDYPQQDDPVGEKDPKKLKTSTPTRILRGRRTPGD